ncbi:MAG: hypothetical protein R3C26_10785 [Calditrichia bacterium]
MPKRWWSKAFAANPAASGAPNEIRQVRTESVDTRWLTRDGDLQISPDGELSIEFGDSFYDDYIRHFNSKWLVNNLLSNFLPDVQPPKKRRYQIAFVFCNCKTCGKHFRRRRTGFKTAAFRRKNPFFELPAVSETSSQHKTKNAAGDFQLSRRKRCGEN